jgi:hypothetical protein
LAGFVNALGLLWKRLNQEISKSHCPIHPAIPRKKRHFNTAATNIRQSTGYLTSAVFSIPEVLLADDCFTITSG